MVPQIMIGCYPIEAQFFQEASFSLERIIASLERDRVQLSTMSSQIDLVMEVFDQEDTLRAQLANSIIDILMYRSYRASSIVEDNGVLPAATENDLFFGLAKTLLEQKALEGELLGLRRIGSILKEQHKAEHPLPDYATHFLNLIEKAELSLHTLSVAQQLFINKCQAIIDQMASMKKNAQADLEKIATIIDQQ